MPHRLPGVNNIFYGDKNQKCNTFGNLRDPKESKQAVLSHRRYIGDVIAIPSWKDGQFVDSMIVASLPFSEAIQPGSKKEILNFIQRNENNFKQYCDRIDIDLHASARKNYKQLPHLLASALPMQMHNDKTNNVIILHKYTHYRGKVSRHRRRKHIKLLCESLASIRDHSLLVINRELLYRQKIIKQVMRDLTKTDSPNYSTHDVVSKICSNLGRDSEYCLSVHRFIPGKMQNSEIMAGSPGSIDNSLLVKSRELNEPIYTESRGQYYLAVPIESPTASLASDCYLVIESGARINELEAWRYVNVTREVLSRIETKVWNSNTYEIARQYSKLSTLNTRPQSWAQHKNRLKDFSKRILESAVYGTDAHSATLRIYNSQNQALEPVQRVEDPPDSSAVNIESIPISDARFSVNAQSFKSSTPQYINDLAEWCDPFANDPVGKKYHELMLQRRSLSERCYPLMYGVTPIGVINFESPKQYGLNKKATKSILEDARDVIAGYLACSIMSSDKNFLMNAVRYGENLHESVNYIDTLDYINQLDRDEIIRYLTTIDTHDKAEPLSRIIEIRDNYIRRTIASRPGLIEYSESKERILAHQCPINLFNPSAPVHSRAISLLKIIYINLLKNHINHPSDSAILAIDEPERNPYVLNFFVQNKDYSYYENIEEAGFRNIRPKSASHGATNDLSKHGRGLVLAGAAIRHLGGFLRVRHAGGKFSLTFKLDLKGYINE